MANRRRRGKPAGNGHRPPPIDRPLVVNVLASRCQPQAGPPGPIVELAVVGVTPNGEKVEAVLNLPARGVQDLRRDLRNALEPLLPLDLGEAD